MKKLPLLIIVFILLCVAAQGQIPNSTEIFTGRGELNNPQLILDLSNQNLEKVPVSALNPEIETLILDNNQLRALPSWIGQLKNLKVLSLRNNKFRELDYGINNCEKLEQLYLSGNKELSDISSISTSSMLKLIDVTDTKINDLPSGIQMMDNLFYFKYSKR